MSKRTFSVTQVVTAVRCPRQLVLHERGVRVVPYGNSAFGKAAHAALSAIAKGALEDSRLHALLDTPLPDRPKVERELLRLALGGAFSHAKTLAPRVDGSDLGRFASTVRNIARLLLGPLTRRVAEAESGRAAAHAVFLGSETDVAVELDGATLKGRIDLLCQDMSETWLWDLKTHAGTHDAELEQVRVYALAYETLGIRTRPALVHVTRDAVEVRHADPVRADERARLSAFADRMGAWLDGAPPPPAPDLSVCRQCPAQDECWRSWGRTLPDELDDVPKPERRASTTPKTRAADPSAPSLPPVVPAPPSPSAPPPVTTTPGPSAPPPVTTTPIVVLGGDPRPPERANATSDSPAPLFLGKASDRRPFSLDPGDLTRHVAVFGASGSGKTYFAKSIVEEAILSGIPVLAFDVQGDILPLAQAATDEKVPEALRERRERYFARAEHRLLTPMSDAGLRVSVNPIRFPKGALGDEKRTIYAESVAENLLAYTKIPKASRDHAKAYLAQKVEIAMRSRESLSIDELMSEVRDDDADDAMLDEKGRERLAKDLRLLTVGVNAYTFREGQPIDVDRLVTPSEPGKVPLNVLWLNGLVDSHAKEGFVAMVLAEVYAWMLTQKGGGPRVLLYFDEIGPYMPPNGEPAPKKLLKRIFKEGRKYGVCGLFCTQNFTDVDYKVMSQANTIALGKVNAVQEKRKAIEAFGSPPGFDVPKAVAAQLGAPRGRFIVKCASGVVAEVQGRELLSEHGPVWGEEEIQAATTDDARASWGAPTR